MSDRTIYVYDTVTGKIQYTVDQANDAQVEGFKEKNNMWSKYDIRIR